MSDATVSLPGEGERVGSMVVKVSSEEMDAVEIEAGPGTAPTAHP